MLKHNTYFEGAVQSVGFERNGRRHTVGVVDAGEFHFGTDAAERMTVVSGELWAKLPGDAGFPPFPAGATVGVADRGARSALTQPIGWFAQVNAAGSGRRNAARSRAW